MEILIAGFVLWALVMFPLVEFEQTAFAVISAILAVAALYVYGYNVFGMAFNNPVASMLWVGAYTTIGVIYSFVRWNWVCKMWRRDYDSASSDYLKQYFWSIRPKAKSSKNRITSYMMFWPWSIFWWMVSDLVVETFNKIYNSFSTLYERIANKHIEGIEPPTVTNSRHEI